MYKHVFNCGQTFTALLSAGGVQVSAEQGKIKVVNTLESRLELLGGQVSKLYVLFCGLFEQKRTLRSSQDLILQARPFPFPIGSSACGYCK